MRTYTFFLVVIAAFLSAPINAQTTFNLRTGPTGGLIEDPNTWTAVTGDPADVPSEITSDGTDYEFQLLIEEGATVVVSGEQIINGRITILSGGTLVFVGPTGNPGRLVMNAASSIFIQDGANIISQGPGNSGNAQRLSIGGEEISGPDLNFLNNCPKPTDLNVVTLEVFNGNDPIQCLGGVPLPVEIRSFTANPASNGIEIQWEAEKEWDFSHYELERSADGLDFAKIYEVPGKQTEVAGLLSYTYTDLRPNAGSNYYRLKAVDTDGSSEYHGVVVADFKSGKTYYFSNAEARSLKVWPVDSENALSMRLINMQGQVMWSGEVNAETKIQGIQPGMYVLHSQGAGSSHSQKIIVK